MLRILLVTFLLMAFTTASTAQVPEPRCSVGNRLGNFLTKQYHELPIAEATLNLGGVLRIFTTENRSAWSITITSPRGLTCLIASGVTWTILEPNWILLEREATHE